jgi:hypothetical protein
MRLKADGTPRKPHVFHSFANDENEWRSLEEVGAIIGVSKNRVSQLFTGAMRTVADSVFREIRGRKPTEEELAVLLKDDSFTTIVAEVMQSSAARQDPQREG